jgi:hypothetical protein
MVFMFADPTTKRVEAIFSGEGSTTQAEKSSTSPQYVLNRDVLHEVHMVCESPSEPSRIPPFSAPHSPPFPPSPWCGTELAYAAVQQAKH